MKLLFTGDINFRGLAEPNHEMCADILAEVLPSLLTSPLSGNTGVITVEGTTITCEGMESTMFMGVKREDTGNDRFDQAGREVTPTVQSFKITL